MKDIVNPLILTISTYLKEGRSVTTKSAILDVNVGKGHLSVLHTTGTLSRLLTLIPSN